MNGMQGFEARDGHAERDEAIERRVRAECAAEIAELRLSADTYFIERNSARDVVRMKRKQIEEQAALIESLDASFKALQGNSCGDYADLICYDALAAVEEWGKGK